MIAVVVPLVAQAEVTLRAEIFTGIPWNLPLPLWIEQAGSPTLRLSGRYATHPFELPFYYRIRVIVGTAPREEWALELVHHKLYLLDPPPEVASFSISHGYNLLLASRGWAVGPVWLRFGAGPVITHPESTVRGKTLDERGGVLGTGYYLSGAAVAAMIEHRIVLVGPVYASFAGMITGAYARVPVSDGHADAPNLALHVLVGLGFGGEK